jgi:hypothetical protein
MLPHQIQGQRFSDLLNFSHILHGQILRDGNFVVGAERKVRNRKLHNPHYSFSSANVLIIINTSAFQP